MSDLKPGDEARIDRFSPATPSHLRRRVAALGFVPGTRVCAIRKAPLGDPTEYEVRGARVSLRRAEACLLSVIL